MKRQGANKKGQPKCASCNYVPRFNFSPVWQSSIPKEAYYGELFLVTDLQKRVGAILKFLQIFHFGDICCASCNYVPHLRKMLIFPKYYVKTMSGGIEQLRSSLWRCIIRKKHYSRTRNNLFQPFQNICQNWLKSAKMTIERP